MGSSRPRVLVALSAVWLLVGIPLAQAEFDLGSSLPGFSLTAIGETPVTLRYQEGRLLLTLGSRTEQPKGLILHFFQPDCLPCQAQLKALQRVQEEFSRQGLVIVGCAHRGSSQAVEELARRFDLTLPLLIGEGSDLAKAYSAGDAMALLDSQGVVRFAQVGYSPDDEQAWRVNIQRLLAGQEVATTTIPRKKLQVGDQLPAIRLESLTDAKPLALVNQGNRLAFLDGEGKALFPKASLVFLGRFCAFSREEMVALQGLYEQYHQEGLGVFVVGLYPDREKAQAITRQLGVTYPVFDGHGSYLEKHFAYGCPAYIADTQGLIHYTQIGFEPGDERKYERIIQELLQGHAR